MNCTHQTRGNRELQEAKGKEAKASKNRVKLGFSICIDMGGRELKARSPGSSDGVGPAADTARRSAKEKNAISYHHHSEE